MKLTIEKTSNGFLMVIDGKSYEMSFAEYRSFSEQLRLFGEDPNVFCTMYWFPHSPIDENYTPLA